jgi:hypothetical protein
MAKARYIDANGHFKFYGHPNDDGAIAAIAAGGSIVPTDPPDKVSKWDGNAWVSDPSLVDAVALVDWEDARRSSYPTIGDQLDMLWHAIDTGNWTAAKVKTTDFYNELKAAKDANPKPEGD